MKNFKKIFAILLATFMIGVSTPMQFTANTQTDEITINQEKKTEQTDEVTITDNTNEQNQEEEQLTELNKYSDQQENAPPKAPTYEQGEYDILVPHDGELKHPKDIEGFDFNNGQYPDYPLGWLNGLMETRMAPFNSTITMGVQIGYVDGNGYRTFMNELYSSGELGFCAERGKDPISNSSNYNDGIFETSKKTDAIYVAYNDAYGIMGTTNHEYKFGVAQAGVWFFEGTLEYNATVVVHGHGDVSGKFKQVVDKVNDIWNGGEGSLGFTKSTLTTSYDASTNTLVTEQFRYTDASFDRDASISLEPGFYITKASDNVAVDHLNKNQDFVIRTTDLRAAGTINLTASITMEKPVGKLFSHLTMADTFQAILTFSHTDPTSRSATLNATFEPATGDVEIPKTTFNETITPFVFDYSKFSVEIYDASNVKVATKSFDASGKVTFTDLLLGDYTWKEINSDSNVVIVKGTGKFTINPGEKTAVTVGNGATNRTAFGQVQMSKLLNNDSTEQYLVDYTKFGYEISGNGITKEYWLNKDNYVNSDYLKLGTYTWKELSKDKGTVIVTGSGTFTISADGQVIDLKNGKGAVNEVANANIGITKKDAEWLTIILKPSTFGLYDYDEVTGTVGNKIDEITVNFLTAKGTFKNIQIGTSGKRTVIIKELVAPDGYLLDEKGVLVTLTTENHNQTIEVDYFNVPEFFTSPEVIKYNEKGEVMDDVPFKLEEIDKNGNVVKLIETLRTSSQGTTRFQNVPSNNQDNESICYRITELRDESNKFYILDEPYEFCGDKAVKIVRYQAVNHPKMFNYPIWKIAESNPVGITADGSIFGLYNNKDELIQEVTIQNNTASINGLTHDEITDDMYWKEIFVGNQALVLDTNKYYVQNVDWLTMESGTILSITDNTETNPIVNKIKVIALSGFKVNEYAQKILGVDFALFAEDTTKDDTGEVEVHKLQDVVTDVNGKFQTNYYPIYLFDGVQINYMQEIATLENLVLISDKHEVPTITAADYGKYEDKQIIELFTEANPLINYNLRLGLGLYKMNEDKEFLPGVEYGLYDSEKRQLATAVTNADGLLLIENIRFDIFINEENPTAEFVEVYIREIKVQDEDKYVLDYTKYYLPNLAGKQDDYKMGDVIMLNTKETAFVNDYLTGEIALAKIDEANEEKKLANATFLFERLTGADATDTIEETTEANEETSNNIEETTENNESRPTKTIDVKQSFQVTTDANGEIIAGELLYGDWKVTEINAPDGYQLPIDADGNPNNTATVTINKETQKVLLKFYNNKKPEILAVTGEEQTSKLLHLLIGGEVVLLSSVLLYFGMRRKNTKKHIVRGVLSLAILLSGTALASVQTQAAPLKPTVEITQETKSIVPNVVDPIDGVVTPIDTITEPTPPTPGEIVVTKPDPLNPSPEPTQEPQNGVEGEEPTEADSTINYAAYTDTSKLANAGEPVLLYIAIGLAVLLLGAIALIVRKLVRQKKEVV